MCSRRPMTSSILKEDQYRLSEVCRRSARRTSTSRPKYGSPLLEADARPRGTVSAGLAGGLWLGRVSGSADSSVTLTAPFDFRAKLAVGLAFRASSAASSASAGASVSRSSASAARSALPLAVARVLRAGLASASPSAAAAASGSAGTFGGVGGCSSAAGSASPLRPRPGRALDLGRRVG